jgi:hypothetical protein
VLVKKGQRAGNGLMGADGPELPMQCFEFNKFEFRYCTGLDI